MSDFIKRFMAIGYRSQMQFLENHLILCQCPSFVRQKVGHPSQFFRDSGGPGYCPGNVLVLLNAPGIEYFSHVKVDSQAYGNEVREE